MPPAYSENPAGPFKDVLNGPLMEGNDPTIFIDPDDPTTRMICSNPDDHTAYCGLLEEDMVTFKTPPAVIAGFDDSWRWFDAPWISKVGKTYYLSFMMRGCDHWLRHERVPPHSSNYYFFYHNTKLRQDRDLHPNSPADRNIAFDRMYVNYTDNMVASCDVHTAMGPPPLKYLNPFTQTPSFLLSSCTEGVNTSPSTSAPRTLEAQPLTLVNVTDGSETRLRFVDFGNTGAKSVTFMAAAQSNSTVTINGMANCQLAATGGLDDYAETTCDLPKGQFINLVNELVFSFTFTHIGIGEGELNFAWWKFERFGPPSPTSLPLSKSLSPIIHKVTLAFETFEMMAPESIVTCDGDGSPLLELVDNLDGSYGLRCELSGLYFCNGEGNKVTFVEGDADPCVKWGLAGV